MEHFLTSIYRRWLRKFQRSPSPAEGDNTCAILTDDSVKCWGGNSFGDVSSMKAKAIALGLNHLCLILLDGSVWCSDIGSVDLGTGRTAKQISSGKVHTLCCS